jgi:Ca2+/Na+ antiporter
VFCFVFCFVFCVLCFVLFCFVLFCFVLLFCFCVFLFFLCFFCVCVRVSTLSSKGLRHEENSSWGFPTMLNRTVFACVVVVRRLEQILQPEPLTIGFQKAFRDFVARAQTEAQAWLPEESNPNLPLAAMATHAEALRVIHATSRRAEKPKTLLSYSTVRPSLACAAGAIRGC